MRKFGIILVVAVAFAFPLFYDATEIFSKKMRTPAQELAYSATEDEMAHPRCLNQDHIRRNNLQNFLKRYSDISQLELPSIQEVAGIRFEDEHPELVFRFMQLVTPPTVGASRAWARNHLDDNQLRVLSGARGCNKVLCAVQKIFGEKEGPLLLLLLTEYDLNLSQFAWELSDSWRADEIDDIMKAIEAVPSFLLPLDLNQKLSHFNRGYIRKGGKGTIANASMEVFDEWDEVRSPARPYFIYHEFAHNWARLHFMKRDVSNEWLRISGWQSPSKDSEETEHENWKLNSSAHSVSIYAKTNPIEDFAESVSAYRYAPQRLKQVSLAKYKFIKDVVYGGLEFTADSCENVETSPLEKELAAFKPDLSPSFIKRLAEPCLIQNLEMLKVPTLKNGFLSCLNLAAARDFLRKKGQLHKDNNDPVVLNNSFDNARVRFRALERAGVAALPDLILKLERPHLATLKLSIERRSCALAYEPERLREQAKQVNAEQFQASLGVSTLNQKLCDSYVADGEKIINEAVLKKKIADYL